MYVKDQKLSYLIGEESNEPYKTCNEYLQDSTTKHAEDIAIVCAHQPANLYGSKSQPLETLEYANSPYLRLSYKQISELVDRLARALAAKKVGPGMPIFTFLPNGLECIAILLASFRLGCTLVPINIRNLANKQEVSHMVKIAFYECPARDSVVFTDSPATAAILDGFSGLANAQRIVSGNDDWKQWTSFSALLENSDPKQCLPDPATFKDTDIDSTILFTSGTTSLPKGCHWSHRRITYFIRCKKQRGDDSQLKYGCRFITALPNNHGMGVMSSLHAVCTGSSLIFAANYWEPAAFLKIAQAERCTHTFTVPTMVYALVLTKATLRLRWDHLIHVSLGGAGPTPEVLRLCTKEMGAEGCEVTYGMTEGILIFSGHRSSEDLINANNETTCGTVMPGFRIKICAPGSRKPLPRGEPGEIHGTGLPLCPGYIGKQSEEFYEEEGLRWFVSGDMARMDEQGEVFPVGRYKDMIIRGGENLSPNAIEAVIGEQLPHLRDHQVQVIGIPDTIAGEVPIVVTAQKVDPGVVREIKDIVLTTMGKMYAIDDVLFIGDLGLQDYPRTMLGKIQKQKLKDLVHVYCKELEQKSSFKNGYTYSGLADQVKIMWSRIVGASSDDLSEDTLLGDMADSITLMRAKDRLFKTTGIDLSLKEMLDARTLGGLLRILESRIASTTIFYDNTQIQPTEQPPTIDQMAHTLDDEEVFQATKDLVTKTIEPVGLAWDDVRDVMPALDLTEIAAKKGIFARFTIKMAMLARKKSVQTLQAAIVKAAANNPILSSFIIWDEEAMGNDIALQFTVEQTPQFLGNIIEDKGALKTVAELRQLAFNTAQQQGTHYPGPLYRALLYYVEETQCAAVIHNIDHTVADAISGQLFLEDLDMALNGTQLPPHVPYKFYCDHFYNTRNSPAARASTKYHVQKLKDLRKHKSHFFPPLEQPMLLEDGKPDGYIHKFPANSLNVLMRSHPNLRPSVILKAAVALCILHTTEYSHAILAHWEASRDKFPFTTTSNAVAPNIRVGDVGGQLINSVLNLICITPGETKLAFLNRLQEEQILQSKHAAAPWKEIMRQLDPETAELFPEYCTECVFNWLGTNVQGKNAWDNLELLNVVNRSDLHRFYTSASLVSNGKGDVSVMLHVKGSVFTSAEVEGFARTIEKATLWLVENLDQPAQGFKEYLRNLNNTLRE